MFQSIASLKAAEVTLSQALLRTLCFPWHSKVSPETDLLGRDAEAIFREAVVPLVSTLVPQPSRFPSG